MKKIYLLLAICCIPFVDVVAQTCQITLTSTVGTNVQSVCLGSPITPITYTVGAGVSSISVFGLPTGTVTATPLSSSSFTISGTTQGGSAGGYTYTVIASGTCTQTATTGTISVIPLPTATITGNTTVCKNSAAQNIVFKAAGVSSPYMFTYQINGGGNLTVNTISGSSATITAPTGSASVSTYSLISVRDGSGKSCSQSQSGSAVVTVNSLPTGVITGTNIVCKGDPAEKIIFTGASSSPPYKFTYTINGGAQHTISTISGNTATVVVPTVTEGIYTYSLLSVKDGGSPSCSQAQSGSSKITIKSLGVNILTTNASGTVPCDGYLEAVAKGTFPFTYVWSDSVNVNSPYRYSQCAGEYNVIISDSAAICTDTAYANISNNSPPAINNPIQLFISSTSASSDTKCDGTAIATVSGGVSPYIIYFANDTIQNSSYSINNLCVGFYTINVKDAQSQVASFIFVVGSPSTTFYSPEPDYPNTTPIDTLLINALQNCNINYGNIDSAKITSYTFTGSDSINATWTIYQHGGVSSSVTVNTQYGNILTPGVYTVLLDLYCTNRTSGSVRATDDIYIDDRTLNILSSIKETGDLILYPNPFNKKLSVEIEKNSIIKITDVSGKEVYNNVVSNSGAFEIDTDHLDIGVYFITVISNKTSSTKKIIKN